MATFNKKVMTKRIETALGIGVVVKHAEMSRLAQLFAQTDKRGAMEWFAWCADFYSPGAPPLVSRVPELGGYRTIDDAERAVADIAPIGISNLSF